jgi:hypothetical protein
LNDFRKRLVSSGVSPQATAQSCHPAKRRPRHAEPVFCATALLLGCCCFAFVSPAPTGESQTDAKTWTVNNSCFRNSDLTKTVILFTQANDHHAFHVVVPLRHLANPGSGNSIAAEPLTTFLENFND